MDAKMDARRAAIRKSTRAGSATRPDSGARRRRPSTGSRSPRPCSIRTPASTAAGFPMASATPATTRSTVMSIAGRGTQAAIIYDSPVTGTKQTITYAALQTKTETLAGILKHHFGVQKGDRVILYMPMVPEALVAMLACARIGAVHSVVFGGFAPKELATRIDDATPKVILSASCGIEAARVIAYKPLLDAAIDLAKHKPDACLILQRPQLTCELTPGRDHDWQATWDKALVWAWNVLEPVPVQRHRSALHPLHLGHDRHPEGRRARQRRPHGRAAMVDAESLRRQSRRDLVVRLRHRLGGRPQLHRLCAAAARRDLDPLRGQAGRHARRRRLLARHLRARRGRVLHRADRVPRHQEGRPRGQAFLEIRSVEIPHAVPRRRARRSRHHPVGRAAVEEARHRSLVADRNRLVHRRQPGGPRPASGQARLADGGDAGLRRARGRRRLPTSCRAARWARSSSSCRCRRPACRPCGTRTTAWWKATSRNFPATTKPPTPAMSTRTATSM